MRRHGDGSEVGRRVEDIHRQRSGSAALSDALRRFAGIQVDVRRGRESPEQMGQIAVDAPDAPEAQRAAEVAQAS